MVDKSVSEAARALVRLRWDKMTEEERRVEGRRLTKARFEKRQADIDAAVAEALKKRRRK